MAIPQAAMINFETYKIVNTDNYGGDYPSEKFVEGLPHLATKEQAKRIAETINDLAGEHCDRYWKVVKMPYTLQPGFEP